MLQEICGGVGKLSGDVASCMWRVVLTVFGLSLVVVILQLIVHNPLRIHATFIIR
jgi:hypothetical protein